MYEELMEKVVSDGNVGKALRAVVGNKGAAGIDRMRTDQLEEHLERHWPRIRAKLLEGSYAPSPVKESIIRKPGGGERKLGIPTVLDRFIQQLLLQELSPIFDAGFSGYSYGFRPGRSQHGAVEQARRYILEGKDWVVDIDIEKFFDRVNHDILMTRIGKVIRDKRVLKLTGRYLRSGIMVNGVVMEREEGTPQGGPLSPLLANIYLDPLDQELQKRGHCFVRYADDCNVYVGGPAAADRVMENLVKWIEKHLKLKVNLSKSGNGRPWERKFLGFRWTREGQIEVSPESIARFKAKVRQLWDGNRSRTSRQLKEDWEGYLKGWWQYYGKAEWIRPVLDLDRWIRRHMRKCFWIRWHCWRGRQRALRRLGVPERVLRGANCSRGAWAMAQHPALNMALSNKTLRQYGFLVPSDFARKT
jgi:group II intron reverse transcriptase/maturase